MRRAIAVTGPGVGDLSNVTPTEEERENYQHKKDGLAQMETGPTCSVRDEPLNYESLMDGLTCEACHGHPDRNIEGIEGGGSVGDAAGNDNNNDDAVSSFGLLGASSTPQPSKTHPTSPKKRKYTNAATSTRDENGQEAFTVEISAGMRSWNSRGKKKTKQEKAKQKQLAKKI
ncbi:hypothetical protein F5Y07DRAFT_409857 [Xylaria sp. FL0933]|nr:hypothetical protein F5Y07DRAFT_409857 [Xylaria sp. FL0933]